MSCNRPAVARRRICESPLPARAAPTVAVLLLLSLLCAGSPALAGAEPGRAAAAEERDPWEPLRLLAGTWEGEIEGRLGTGIGRRRYELLWDGLYLLSRHSSIRLPQEKSPRGDHHRELGVYSFDRERGTIVLREFIVEGFVLQYACETAPRRFVCKTESVENGRGMRGRLTVEIDDPALSFLETFELASPGEELSVYFTNRWTRAPDVDD